jgi:hypothetical protein
MQTILFILFLPILAMASPAEEPKNKTIPILDATQEFFGLRANNVANRLDLFFGEQRADDELARSRIRFRQRYELRDRAQMTDDFQFRFNIKLPKLEDKFKFEFDKKEKSKNKEKAKQKARSGNSDAIAKVGLDRSWQFRSDIGVNAGLPPTIFSRGRLRKNTSTGDVIHRFVEELAWYSDRHWEQLTTFDSDLSLGDELLLRFRSVVDWKITSQTFQTSHGPSIIQRLSDNEAISYGPSLSTVVDSGIWYVTNYRLSLAYRLNLYKQWLYLDAIPGLDFPKIGAFRRTPFIIFQVEALFGGQ